MTTLRYRPIPIGSKIDVSDCFLSGLKETFGLPCTVGRSHIEKLAELGAPALLLNQVSIFGLVQIVDEEQFAREVGDKAMSPR